MPNFEKLDAYRVSMELTELAFRIAKLLPDARLSETEAAKALTDRAAALLSKMSL